MSDLSFSHLPADLQQQLDEQKQRLQQQKDQLNTRLANQFRQCYHEHLTEAEREGLADPEKHAQTLADEFAEQLQEEAAPEFERLDSHWNEFVGRILAEADDLSDNGDLHEDPSSHSDGDSGAIPPSNGRPPDDKVLPAPVVAQRAEMRPDFLVGADQIEKRGSKKRLKQQGGLLVVQSAADVEQLRKCDVLSVGLSRPQHTPEQIKRIIALAKQYAEAKVQTWLPLEEAGRQAMWKLVQALLPEVFVRVPITSKSAGGIFVNKSPADLGSDELKSVRQLLQAPSERSN